MNQTSALPEVASPPAGSDDYIQIVDDEPGIPAALHRGLAEAGFACLTAASGSEALARLKGGRFALMLRDIRMRVWSGWRCCRVRLPATPTW